MLWNLSEHEGTFVNTTNPEILHVYGDNSSLVGIGDLATPHIYGSTNVTYGVSSDMQAAFLKGDLQGGTICQNGHGNGCSFQMVGDIHGLGGV